MPAHTRVLVRGLAGAAQHNGKGGEITSFDDSSRRYTVELEDGDVVSIKGENLLQPCVGEVTGMVSKPELNGRSGRVREYDEAKGRYHVEVQGQVVSLKPDNLILPKDTRARVVGLVSQLQWNGKVGKVLDFDRERGRCAVQMSEEHQLMVKLENLLL